MKNPHKIRRIMAICTLALMVTLGAFSFFTPIVSASADSIDLSDDLSPMEDLYGYDYMKFANSISTNPDYDTFTGVVSNVNHYFVNTATSYFSGQTTQKIENLSKTRSYDLTIDYSVSNKIDGVPFSTVGVFSDIATGKMRKEYSFLPTPVFYNVVNAHKFTFSNCKNFSIYYNYGDIVIPKSDNINWHGPEFRMNFYQIDSTLPKLSNTYAYSYRLTGAVCTDKLLNETVSKTYTGSFSKNSNLSVQPFNVFLKDILGSDYKGTVCYVRDLSVDIKIAFNYTQNTPLQFYWNYYTTVASPAYSFKQSASMYLDCYFDFFNTEKTVEVIKPAEDFDGDYTSWLGTAVGGFFTAEIFPGFSLGGLVLAVMAVPICLWFLKLFNRG